MTTLPLFWRLSSTFKADRIDASVKLISTLEHFQSQFVASNSPEYSEDESEAEPSKMNIGLDGLNAQDVSYSIKRLVRGLASPRECSRLGFAVALTELLSRITTVTCSQIISLILDSSKTQGSMTGQEERDVLFARLFGLTAVIQSSLLVRTTPVSISASSTIQPSALADYKEVLSQLITLGQKKSWMKESAWWTITLAVDALHNSDISWKEEAIEHTIQCAFLEDTSWSPEKIAITLKLQKARPDKNWRKILSPSFKTSDLFTTAHLPILARILKECPSDDDNDDEKVQVASRSWSPRLHFVWSYILDWLLPSPDAACSSKGSFEEFFRVVVDESLFSANVSPERKYWGFAVFRMALPRVDIDRLPMLFTKNFMRCWINHLSQKDRYLHKVAIQVATEIQDHVRQKPALGFTLLVQLTGVNGSRQFDKVTKTKTVGTILNSMDIDGVKGYVDYLIKQTHGNSQVEEDEDIHTVNSRRVWVIDQLATLIRSGSIPKGDEWVLSVLNWLTVHGLFSVHKALKKSSCDALNSIPNPPFSDEVRKICRLRLLACLADLTGSTAVVKLGDKTSKMSGMASDGEFWITKVQSIIHSLEGNAKHLKPLARSDGEDIVIQKAWDMVVRLQQNVTGPMRESARGVELLLVASIVRQRCEEEPSGADQETLEGCVEACQRMFFNDRKKSKSKTQKASNDTVETSPEPIDIFVDTVIGYLEKSPESMRTIGNLVFSLLCDHAKESTVDLILAQLERRNPAELAEDEDELEPSSQSGESEEDSVGEESDDSASDSEDPDPGIRQELEEIVQYNPDDSNDESEEELMDDDQMMAMDERLAAVFRERSKTRSTKNVDVQRQATHFKNRVLDLVETFLKKQPTNSCVIRCIIPLVDLLTSTATDERQVADKAKGILRSRIGKQKEGPSSFDPEHLMTILKEIHIRSRKAHSRETLETLSQTSLYLARLLLRADQEESVLRIYRQSLVDFITRKNSTLSTGFFEDFVRQFPMTVWKMRSDILDLNTKATNTFRRCQAFQLLQILLSRVPTDELKPDILQFMPSLRKSLQELISSACEEKVTLTTRQLKDLFKFCQSAIRQTKHLTPSSEEIHIIWEPPAWNEIRELMMKSKRLKSSTALQNMCQQTAHLAVAALNDPSSKVATKRRAKVISDEESQVPKPRKKAKQRND